jgi:hypothetical protein
MSIYKEHGFDSRQAYLESLSDEYDVSLETVESVSDLLGEDEDFDGLPIELDSIREINQYTI